MVRPNKKTRPRKNEPQRVCKPRWPFRVTGSIMASSLCELGVQYAKALLFFFKRELITDTPNKKATLQLLIMTHQHNLTDN